MFVRLGGSVLLMIVAVVVLSNAGCSDKEKKADPKTKGGDAQVKAKEETPTWLTIPNMDDQGCADNVKSSLIKLAGVADVQCDIKAKTVKVVPKTGVTLSPKALWEAADASGENPSKLDGPSGLFTAKPKE